MRKMGVKTPVKGPDGRAAGRGGPVGHAVHSANRRAALPRTHLGVWNRTALLSPVSTGSSSTGLEWVHLSVLAANSASTPRSKASVWTQLSCVASRRNHGAGE